MKLRTLTLSVLIIATSCSNRNLTGKNLTTTAAYSSPEKIISQLKSKAETPSEHFILARAYEKKKQYKPALLHYANSSFSSYRNTSLRLFAQPVYRHVSGFHFKSPYYDDALLQTALIFNRYREYQYVLKFLELIDDDNRSLFRESLELKIRVLTRLKKYPEARKEIKNALKTFKAPSVKARFYIRQASLNEHASQYEMAKEDYIWILKNHRNSWQEGVAVRRLLSALNSSRISFITAEKLLLAEGLYNSKDYKNAFLLLDDLYSQGKLKKLSLLLKSAARYKKYKKADEILSGKNSHSRHRLTYAEELWKTGRESRAYKEYQKLLKETSLSSKSMVLYRCGKYHEDRRNRKFIDYFYKMINHDPATIHAGEALWLTGRFYLREENRKKAIQYLEESLLRDPSGKHSDQCRFWLCSLYRQQRANAKYNHHLIKMVSRNPDSTYTWRILPEIAKTASIRKLKTMYQSSLSDKNMERALYYHALLTLAESNDTLRTARIKDFPESTLEPYNRLDSLIFKKENLPSQIKKQLDTYFSSGYRKGIKRTIETINQMNISKPDIYAGICRIASQYNNYFSAVYYLQLLMKEESIKENFFIQSARVNTTLLPQSFEECVKKKSAEFHIKEEQIFAMIKAESLFNHRAVSPAGATGLMQLMPATARGIARQLHMSHYDLKDPCTSIAMGAHYIAWLNRFFKNDYDLVVAGYNAGAGNVKKWKKRITLWGKDYFAEFIPFAETRYYIFRTNKYLHQYAALYR